MVNIAKRVDKTAVLLANAPKGRRMQTWNLDFKNPNGPAAAEHKTPKQLLGEIKIQEVEILKVQEFIESLF